MARDPHAELGVRIAKYVTKVGRETDLTEEQLADVLRGVALKLTERAARAQRQPRRRPRS